MSTQVTGDATPQAPVHVGVAVKPQGRSHEVRFPPKGPDLTWRTLSSDEEDSDEWEYDHFIMMDKGHGPDPGRTVTRIFPTADMGVLFMFTIFMLFDTVSAEPMSPALENSKLFSEYTNAIGWFLIYLMAALCLRNLASVLSALCSLFMDFPKVCAFLSAEWLSIKATVPAFVVKEVGDFKKIMMLGSVMQLIPIIFGTLTGVLGLIFGAFSSKVCYPQGWRGDANRSGSVLTGLLSICMILVAPLMGVDKVLKYFKPVIDLLRQLPYATWMMEWIQKWWNATTDAERDNLFSELPQTDQELKEAMQQSRGAEKLQDELAALNEMQKKFEGSTPFRDESTMTEEQKEKKRKFQEALKRAFNAIGKEPELISSEDESDWSDSEDERVYPARSTTSSSSDDDNDENLSSDATTTTTTTALIEELGKLIGEDGSPQMDKIDEMCAAQKDVDDRSGLKAVEESKKKTRDSKKLDHISTSFVSGGDLKDQDKKKKRKSGELKPQMFGSKPSEAWTECKRWIFWTYVTIFAQCNRMGEQMTSADIVKDIPADAKMEGATSDDSGVFIPVKAKDLNKANSRFAWKWWVENRDTVKKVAWGVVIVGLALYGVGAYKATGKGLDYGKRVYNGAFSANGQSKKSRATRTRTRKHKNGKYISPSGGAEQEPEDEDWEEGDYYYGRSSRIGDEEYEDSYYQERTRNEYDMLPTDPREDPRHERRAKRQGIPLKMPNMKDDSSLRRAINAAKKRTYRAPENKANTLKAKALETFNQLSKEEFERLSKHWKPLHLAGGVYKFYVDDRYACTATHVGNRLYVVLHCLSEDITTSYRATNHVNSFFLRGSDAVIVNKEVAYFPVSGVPSVWKNKDFRVMEDAEIVTVFGFGSGESNEPDAIVGFASPLGWCNAPTRNGDCTAPVLDVNGKIVGFWTHGNGKDFGRYEPVTPGFKESQQDNISVLHSGLDFRSSPHSQQHC
jgi:hypothetical protein